MNLVIELKSVSAGSGTYFNTSIYYFLKFNFNFKKYMEQYGLYKALEDAFGSEVSINRKNNSPVSQSDSSYIRHNYKDLYETTIIPIDENLFLGECKNYKSEQNLHRISRNILPIILIKFMSLCLICLKKIV